MDPITGAALIGAGSNLLSGITGAGAQRSANKTNLQIARENNLANQQLQKNQNEWNLGQWERENKYNSASSQKERLLAAGYNPALAAGQVATGSATSNQLQSAPYTPNQQVQVQPVNYAQGLGNAANDFVNTYLNMSMNKAQIDKTKAEADNLRAQAGYVTGYQGRLAESNILSNETLAQLHSMQTRLQEVNYNIAKTYGAPQAAADLDNSVSNALKTRADTIKSEQEARNIVAKTVTEYARANNIKLDSDRIRRTTELLVSKMQLENQADSLLMTGLQKDADFEIKHGTETRSQQLNMLRSDALRKHYETNMTRKTDKMWWTNQTMRSLDESSNIFGNIMGGLSKYGSFKKSTAKPDNYNDYDKHTRRWTDKKTGDQYEEQYYRKSKSK